MPIYIKEGNDHRQISADDLAKIMNIDRSTVKKIQKNPVFEVNPKLTRPDKLNGGIIAPAGKGSKPIIYVKVGPPTKESPHGVIVTDDAKAMNATTIKLMYCISIIPNRENENIFSYEPKRLNFYDRLEIINNNLEQALFFYCLPACKNSPVADKRNWYYTFQDKENAALENVEKATLISRAFSLIQNGVENGGLSDASLVLVAKGLYTLNTGTKLIPNPSARNKTITEIKSDLINLAYKDPALFLESTDDDVNKFYGMVMDAVDRGIFEVVTAGKVRAWFWKKGPENGKQICHITGSDSDFNQLKAAIEANPNAFYANITRAVSEAQGKDNVAAFMKQQKEEDYVPNFDEGQGGGVGEQAIGELEFIMPSALNKEGYQHSVKMAILFNNGERPSPGVLSKFWSLIKENKVNADNVKQTLETLVKADI